VSTDLALGGLNYQIEHHLFPSMPGPNLAVPSRWSGISAGNRDCFTPRQASQAPKRSRPCATCSRSAGPGRPAGTGRSRTAGRPTHLDDQATSRHPAKACPAAQQPRQPPVPSQSEYWPAALL